MKTLYPAMDSCGQILYLLMMVAMTIRGWWRKFPIFYVVQAVQFAELLWILWVLRTGTTESQRTAFDQVFWPNLAAELLVLITCFASKNRDALSAVGMVNAVHLYARFLWSHTTDIPTMFDFGGEYFLMKLTNLAIYPAVLWALYSSRGNPPQESTHVRSEQGSRGLVQASS